MRTYRHVRVWLRRRVGPWHDPEEQARRILFAVFVFAVVLYVIKAYVNE